MLNLETGERRELVPGRRPVYSLNGYLIHGSTEFGGQGLWALPFSLALLQSVGEDFPISAAGIGATVSQDGTLVYLESSQAMNQMVWRDRTGKILETVGQPQPNMNGGPLARRLADRGGVYRERQPGHLGLRLIRSTKIRLTFDNERHSRPAWSPSGREIAYHVPGGGGIRGKAADGMGEPVVLVRGTRTVKMPTGRATAATWSIRTGMSVRDTISATSGSKRAAPLPSRRSFSLPTGPFRSFAGRPISSLCF